MTPDDPDLPIDPARAWSDPAYRASLPPDAVPPNPAGEDGLSDDALEQASGGQAASTEQFYTAGCCDGPVTLTDWKTVGAITLGCCDQ